MQHWAEMGYSTSIGTALGSLLSIINRDVSAGNLVYGSPT